LKILPIVAELQSQVNEVRLGVEKSSALIDKSADKSPGNLLQVIIPVLIGASSWSS